MFILGEFFLSLAYLVNGICTLLYWLLFARIVISWVPVDPFSGPVQFLMQVTEPILAPFRRLPLRIGMMDLSPIAAFIALQFINRVLVRILQAIAVQLGGGF